VSAIGNDYGFDYIFARQIEALGLEGNVFIGLSTSGRSSNAVRGLTTARARGLITVGLTGADGRGMLELCEYCIRVPSTKTPRIQEGYEMLGHILCALIERRIFPVNSPR